MQIQQDAATREKRIYHKINKVFLISDVVLLLLSIILSLVFIKKRCVSLMFLYYTSFYLVQSGKHYLIHSFPTIDINKHNVLYRRLVIAICLSDTGYLFATIMFWQRTQNHPIYCTLCIYLGFSAWIGIVLIFHFIFTIGWSLTLVQSYIHRRYYLLGIGGFQAEQRIIQQRQRQLHQMMIRQPNNEPFPIPKKDKYFNFEDIIQQQLQQNPECSICMNNQKEDDFVNAGCRHFYHRQCLTSWAKVNSNCPQCRHQLEESPQIKVENLSK